MANKRNYDSVWDDCRKALDANALRKAQADAKLQSAALRLGFAKNENGRWQKECPHCRLRVELGTTNNGDVRAFESDPALICSAVPGIQQWLCDEGFQS